MSSKVIIVTGASRGIGLALSNLLLQPPQSCNIVVVSRSKSALEEIQTRAGKDRVEVLAGDLSDLTLGQKAVDAALSRWGRLDGIVINHGAVEPVEKVVDADINEWKNAFDLNVFSAIAMVKAAIPPLRKTNGRIILVSSGAAVSGTSAWGCYGAGKAVLNHLAKTLAKEEQDITTLSIRPGVVATKMQDTLASTHFAKMEPKDTERFKKMKEDGAMLRPEQPGNVMARLVLDAPKKLSGEFLNWNDERLAKFQD